MDAQNKYRRIVIKVGSNVLTRDDGRPDTTRISALGDQVARLHRAGTEVILVSSGAVAAGRSILGQRAGKLDSVSARQLFSAVGQVKLLNRYYDLFNEYGIVCGQVLTTKESLSTRRQYLNQRNCMEALLAAGVVLFGLVGVYINKASDPVITPAVFKNTRWLAAIMLIVLFYFTNYCVSPIFNTMGTTLYNMDVTQVSQYIVWAFIVAAVFGTTSGWIVGKIGRTTAIELASLHMISGIVGTAL